MMSERNWTKLIKVGLDDRLIPEDKMCRQCYGEGGMFTVRDPRFDIGFEETGEVGGWTPAGNLRWLKCLKCNGVGAVDE